MKPTEQVEAAKKRVHPLCEREQKRECRHGYVLGDECPSCDPADFRHSAVEEKAAPSGESLIPQIKHLQGMVNDELSQQEVLLALENLLKSAYRMRPQPDSSSISSEQNE